MFDDLEEAYDKKENGSETEGEERDAENDENNNSEEFEDAREEYDQGE